MVEGLSHITFVVKNLDLMEELLVKIFDAKKVYDSGDDTFSISRERFFDIAGLWIAIMEGVSQTEKSYNHVAFKIDDAQYDDYLGRIKTLGLEIKPGRERVEGEGRSIYFYDFDNHMFELHTGTLTQRLWRYKSGK